MAAKAAEEDGKQPETGGKLRKTADLTLEKDQKDGIQGPQRIVQWSPVAIKWVKPIICWLHPYAKVGITCSPLLLLCSVAINSSGQ